MTHQPPTVGSTEAKLERLHAQLADAVATLVTGDDWVRALEFAARFRSRSFNNTMLIWMQHLAAFEQGRVAEPTPTYVAGFRQWLALGKVGRPRPDRLHDLCACPRAVRLAHPTGRRVMASSCASRDPETQRRSAHANGRRAARIRVGCLADERCPDPPRCPLRSCSRARHQRVSGMVWRPWYADTGTHCALLGAIAISAEPTA